MGTLAAKIRKLIMFLLPFSFVNRLKNNSQSSMRTCAHPKFKWNEPIENYFLFLFEDG